MSKSVLISIKPQYCELIAVGKKTIEVRKTAPKIETPFMCYIYCTKPTHFVKISECMATSQEYLHLCDGKATMSDGFEYFGRDDYAVLNGKVIGEFVCDYVAEFTYDNGGFLVGEDISTTYSMHAQSSLTAREFRAYAGEESVYGWHISDLKIYDKPKELGEFYRNCPTYDPDDWQSAYACIDCKKVCGHCGELFIKRAPQSWCYVEELE